MTPAQFRDLGEALYGYGWQSEIARNLKVSLRTVQRWAAGDYPIPPGVPDELRGIAIAVLDSLHARREYLLEFINAGE